MLSSKPHCIKGQSREPLNLGVRCMDTAEIDKDGAEVMQELKGRAQDLNERISQMLVRL